MKLSERKFKTGQDLVEFVKQQLNKDIKVDETFKMKRGIVYMEIDFDCPITSLFGKYKIRAEHHMKNRYFVYLV
jgi:bacterioferritin (cytochrome b1)